ncbi:hypothetical protein MUK42_20129, partial [Musa troglodytarum]
KLRQVLQSRKDKIPLPRYKSGRLLALDSAGRCSSLVSVSPPQFHGIDPRPPVPSSVLFLFFPVLPSFVSRSRGFALVEQVLLRCRVSVSERRSWMLMFSLFFCASL